MYSAEEMVIANKTSRNTKAIGDNALVPRVVIDYIKAGDNVLDFGAGKHALHALRLKENGIDVTAYEFGENVVEGIHDPQALSRTYSIVYASNVLNVQSNAKMLDLTVILIKRVMKDSGIFIANYPLSPRKMNMDGAGMKKYLEMHFSSVEVLNKEKTKPVFLIKK